MQNILEKLYQGHNLNQIQSEQLINGIINKQLSSAQIGAALISMKIRGETIEEIIGATKALLIHSKPFPKLNISCADITGTGGDKKNTINISTISAFVAAACNIKIIKHGNYSSSSSIGSINLLEACNINITHNPNQYCNYFEKLDICFLCASQYYTVLKDIMPLRKQLNTPTLFNIIGPLINPAQPSCTLIGVYKKELLTLVSQALKILNFTRAIVVHCDGIDEVGLHNVTNVFELNHGIVTDYTLTPSDFGLNTYAIEELYYNSKLTPFDNMVLLLQGKGKLSQTSVIAANVALLLKLFGYNNLRSNVSMVLDTIYSGTPYIKLLSLLNQSKQQGI